MPGSLASEKTSLLIAGALVVAAVALGWRQNGDNAHRQVPAIERGGRGRSATKPSDIPARGWKDILIRVYKSLAEDRVLANAAGVTFYALLALFPAIAALVSVYGLFADPADVSRLLEGLKGLLPGGALDVIGEQLTRVTAQAQGALGLGAIAGLLIALWSANSGVKALFDALNVVYDEQEKRGFFTLNAISLAFTLGAIMFLIIAIAIVVALPIALEFLPLRGFFEWLIHVMRWPLLLLAIVVALALLYRYGPSRDKPRWRWVSWGSVIAGLVWVGASALFSWYAENFGSYNKTYGSLGAVIGFMTWIWISVIVILMGGEINAEMEHQTARDTTKGAPLPMGMRGARMADRLGPAQA
jgi:membrane protein